jgi:hypothetical protein
MLQKKIQFHENFSKKTLNYQKENDNQRITG